MLVKTQKLIEQEKLQIHGGYMFRHTPIYPTLHFFCSNTASKQGKPNICYFALSKMAQGRASETGGKLKNSHIMYQTLTATNWAVVLQNQRNL